MDDTKLNELIRRVEKLEAGSHDINRQTGSLERQSLNDIVQDSLHDTIWNKVSYTSSFASASITTTTTEVLDANGRESDTSQGRRFNPNRPSKFRTGFYLGAAVDKSTVYILSPCVSNVSTAPTSVTGADKSWVGIKIAAGAVSASSSIAGTITNIATTKTIALNVTNLLEIYYYVSHAVIVLNGDVIGDISCNLLTVTCETFFPFLISLGSSDATSVNVTTESYEFLQTRK